MVEKLLISEAYELYRTDYIIMKNLAKKTEESYMGNMKLLINYFGDIDIQTITFENVRDWRNNLLSWQSHDTSRGNVVCIRNVLRFLRTRGYMVLDYEEIPVPKREKRKIKFLNEDEFKLFCAEVLKPVRGTSKINQARNYAIVQLLWASGIRNSELCALDRDTIKNRSFTVVGKSRDERIVFIDSHAESAINAYLKLRKDKNRALFVSHQSGMRLNTGALRKIFAGVCERSSFEKVHPHTIRHSFATRLLEKEVDLRYIGDLMGHVDLNTTKMYTHYSNPQLRRIYETAHKH